MKDIFCTYDSISDQRSPLFVNTVFMNCIYIRPICKKRVLIFQTKNANVSILTQLHFVPETLQQGFLTSIALQNYLGNLGKKKICNWAQFQNIESRNPGGEQQVSVYFKAFTGDVWSGLNCWPRVPLTSRNLDPFLLHFTLGIPLPVPTLPQCTLVFLSLTDFQHTLEIVVHFVFLSNNFIQLAAHILPILQIRSPKKHRIMTQMFLCQIQCISHPWNPNVCL